MKKTFLFLSSSILLISSLLTFNLVYKVNSIQQMDITPETTDSPIKPTTSNDGFSVDESISSNSSSCVSKDDDQFKFFFKSIKELQAENHAIRDWTKQQLEILENKISTFENKISSSNYNATQNMHNSEKTEDAMNAENRNEQLTYWSIFGKYVVVLFFIYTTFIFIIALTKGDLYIKNSKNNHQMSNAIENFIQWLDK